MNLNEFYYNLLNIKNPKTNPLIQIQNVVQEEIEKANIKDPSSYEGLCKYFSINIANRLNDLGFMTTIQNTKEQFPHSKEHQYVLCSYSSPEGIQTVLIDPTYHQFVEKKETLLPPLQAWPSTVLEQTPEGKKLLEQLLKNGFAKVEEATIKYYLGSFLNETDIEKIEYSFHPVEERLKKR